MIQILLMNSGKLLTFNSKQEILVALKTSLDFRANSALQKQLYGHRGQIQTLMRKIKAHTSDTPIMTQLSQHNMESVFTAVRIQRLSMSIYHITIPRLELDLQLLQDCISHKDHTYRVPTDYHRIISVSMMDFVHHIQDIVLVLTPFNSLSRADNQYLRNGILALSKSAKKHVDYGSNIILYNMNHILNKVSKKTVKRELVDSKR